MLFALRLCILKRRTLRNDVSLPAEKGHGKEQNESKNRAEHNGTTNHEIMPL